MKSNRHYAGFVLHEALMALALALTLTASAAELLAIAARTQRSARQEAVAAREVCNLMEAFTARAWNETTARRLERTPLSAECRRWLPDARLRVSVEEDAQDVRRISLTLDWRAAPERRSAATRLVGWKYRDREVSP